jgi:acyl-CoA thioesterase
MPEKVPDTIEGFDLFGDHIGLTFTRWEKGYSQCVLDVRNELLNPHRTLHGGATYTMADSGMGAALYAAIDDDELCATIEIKIVYFEPVKTGRLTCDTRLVHRGTRIATLESQISQDGRLIAKAMGTWSIFKARNL